MDAKAAARERVERARDDLVALSHRIHAHPEVGFEEEHASAWLGDASPTAGFAVDARHLRPADGVRRARRQRPAAPRDLRRVRFAPRHRPRLRPQHRSRRCAVGAALAAATVADDVGLTVSVIGTPAEEGGGGKILLLERGAFAGVHAAMMVHPAPMDVVEPPCPRRARSSRCATPAKRRTRRPSRSAASTPPTRSRSRRPRSACLRQHIRRPTASTASSPTAATRRTSCRRTPPRTTSCAPATLAELDDIHAQGACAASRPARSRPARRSRSSRTTSRTPRCATTRALARRLPPQRRSSRTLLPRPRPPSSSAWPARPTWATSRSRCRRSIR